MSDNLRVADGDIVALVDELMEDPGLKECYIAIIDMGDCHSVEVEIDSGSIGGQLEVRHKLAEARRVADRLDVALTARGVRVFKTRSAWEVAQEGEP
jgi:hypothetical protein